MSVRPRFFRFLWLFALFVLLILPIGAASAGDNNIHWNELGFNSRDPLYRSPVGAVPVGTPVRVRLKALDGDLTSAQVRVWNDRINGESVYDLTRVAGGVTFSGDPNTYEFWEATLPASAVPTVYWYRFIVKDGSATAYYEDDGARDQGWGATFGGSPDNSYQLTFYDPAFQTPDWVKNAVIYQVFVDRFRDGNGANNTPASSFFYGANDLIVRSNAAAWNTAVCDPRAVAGSASTCANMYSQNFYGGDLQGVIDELGYLDALGVTAIYLNPIFESPSNHKYDGSNYYQIDDNFGDLALFQSLAAQAHALGINIILDGVFNHTSSDSIYFDRYSRWNAAGGNTPVGTDDNSGACESSVSPYFDWYRYYGAGEPGGTLCSETGQRYRSWFGFDSLPILDPFQAEVREYVIDDNSTVDGDPIAVARYWMQWADGWRLDVGGDLDQGTINSPDNSYWEDFRAAVHATNPNAYIVGEEWGNATSWTIDNQWDATMNYQFSSAYLSFYRDETFVDNDHNSGSSAGVLSAITPTQFNDRIENWQERYAPEAFYAMMNLLGSHDTNRALFMLDPNTSSNNTALYNSPTYDWTDAVQRMLGVVMLQMTMPGAPTIYYGDEVGTVNAPAFDGSQWQDDPYNRVPYPWLDQTGTPYYTHMQSSIAQNAMRAYYSLLTGARNAHPALRTGSYDPLLLADGQDVIAYGRKSEDDSDVAVVLANGSDVEQSVTVDVSGYLPNGLVLYDLFTNNQFTVTNGAINVSVTAKHGRVLLVFGANGFSGRPAHTGDLSAANAANQITLNWSDAANAASYDVYRSPLSGGGYQLVGSSASSDYQDTSVTNGVTYCYVIVGKSSSGLESDWSNEVCKVPGYDLGGGGVWFNLQWPHTINHILNLNNPTENIYGQIWIDGATYTPGATVGISAQVGYGPQGDAPSLPSWTWFPMTFNGQSGNNDEFVGTLLPTQVGTFYYTTRYSADGGATWYYTDKNSPPYDAADAGVLTVTQSDDTTAPAAPINLVVLASTSTSATLGWDAHPNTDGDLAGFEIWRETDGTPGFTKVATVADPNAVQYVNTGLTPNMTYNYYIKAYDTATNASAPSNTVSVTSEFRMVNVTFNVTVPAGTPPTVYVAGSFPSPYAEWNPGGIGLTYAGNNVWTITLQILDGTVIEYKYARGSWDTVEKDADFNELPANRNVTVSYGVTGNQTVTNTVASWRDPYVVSFTPASGATVAGSPAISATWSTPMNSGSVTNAAGFTVTGAVSGAISGTLSYDDPSRTVTFTPNSALANDSYTVNISGRQDGQGDMQQVAASWTFTVLNPPGVVSAVAPLGAINSDPVAFTWTDVAGAKWYQIWISGPEGYVFSGWYDAYFLCLGGNCTLPSPVGGYAPGQYSWWIQAWGDGGYGAWSSAFDFALVKSPATAVPLTPTATITSATPTFTWADVPGVDWYYLWLAEDGHVLDQWYNAWEVCAGGTCSVTPALTLETGSYTWWLQTYSNVGTYGAWSNWQKFNVYLPLDTPTPTAPIGSVTGASQTFTWTGDAGADWFYLWIANANGTGVANVWYNANAICVGTTCSVNPGSTFADGSSYRWWVLPWNQITGSGSWSAEANFSVNAPLIGGEAPVEIAPPAAPVDEVIPAPPVEDVTPPQGG